MYLLDTGISSYLMKRVDPSLGNTLKRFSPGELKVSAVTVFELASGARRTNRYERLIRVIDAFLDNTEVLSFITEAAREAGRIRAELAAAGKMIGAYDLLIAGPRALGATW